MVNYIVEFWSTGTTAPHIYVVRDVCPQLIHLHASIISHDRALQLERPGGLRVKSPKHKKQHPLFVSCVGLLLHSPSVSLLISCLLSNKDIETTHRQHVRKFKMAPVPYSLILNLINLI